MRMNRGYMLAAVCAGSLMTAGCANMNSGAYLGAIAGAAAGGYAGSEMDDGSGTMTGVGAVIGGSLGMVLGSGAVTPGEMAQAAVDARVAETIAQGTATTPANPDYPGVAATASATTVAGGSGAAADSGLSPKSVGVYFTVGMIPTEKNTRNPVCYSNAFNVTIPFDPKGWGNAGRLNEVIEPMMDDFYAKCAQLGGVTSRGNVSYGASDNIASGWPRPAPHSEDYVVTMP